MASIQWGFRTSWAVQRKNIVHTWEVEARVLRMILVERGKGNNSGGGLLFSSILEEDFVGILVGCVLQQS